jgi:hypothetical protein
MIPETWAHKVWPKLAIALPATDGRAATQAHRGGVPIGDEADGGGSGCRENLRCLKPGP